MSYVKGLGYSVAPGYEYEGPMAVVFDGDDPIHIRVHEDKPGPIDFDQNRRRENSVVITGAEFREFVELWLKRQDFLAAHR